MQGLRLSQLCGDRPDTETETRSNHQRIEIFLESTIMLIEFCHAESSRNICITATNMLHAVQHDRCHDTELIHEQPDYEMIC